MGRVLIKEKNSLASSLALKNTASGNVYPTKVMGIATLFFFRLLKRTRIYSTISGLELDWTDLLLIRKEGLVQTASFFSTTAPARLYGHVVRDRISETTA